MVTIFKFCIYLADLTVSLLPFKIADTLLFLIYRRVNVIKFVPAHRRHKKRTRFCGWHFQRKKILIATSDTVDGVGQILLY